jgi:transcriptional regulator with XRE-family HTH domain
MNDAAQAVREARQRMGLSLRAAGERAEVSHTALFRFEGGELGAFGEEAIERVARSLDLDPIEMLCAVGRVPTMVVLHLARHPEIVRRLHAEAIEEGT